MAELQHQHKHHHSLEKELKNKKLKRIAKMLFYISAVMLVPYLAMEFFPFIRSIFAHDKINLTTIFYALLRIAMVGVPIIFILPAKLYNEHIDKTDLLSKWFAAVAFLFFASTVVDIMTYNVFADYVDGGQDPIMLKMLWGNIELSGLVFSFVMGIGYLMLWKRLTGHKKQVIQTFTIIYVLYPLMPILYTLLTGASFTSHSMKLWFEKNIWFFISDFILLAGLVVSASSRRAWSEIIWK